MGTRGVMGFLIKGKPKITYNHFDSYPSGLGVQTLEFLRESELELVAELAGKLRVVGKRKPTAKQIEELSPYTDRSVDHPESTSWYQLLRRTQGDWAAILEAGYIEDSSEFALDSVFCEWGYVINFDRGMLEVYEGFQKWVPLAGLWAGRPTQEDDQRFYQEHLKYAKKNKRDPWMPETSEYKAIALIAAWPLDSLPTDEEFLARVDPREEDE